MIEGGWRWLTLMLAATDWMRMLAGFIGLEARPALLWLGDEQARPPSRLWQLLTKLLMILSRKAGRKAFHVIMR